MQNLIEKSLKKRYRSEKKFQNFGAFAILFALFFLVVFLTTIFIKGHKAFITNKIALEIDLSEENLQQNINENSLEKIEIKNLTKENLIEKIGYQRLIKQALRQKFSQLQNKEELNSLYKIIGEIADFRLQRSIEESYDLLGSKHVFWLEVSSKIDIYLKHKITSQLNENEILLIDNLVKNNEIKSFFNWQFFKSADSREPESAGIAAGLVGSFFVMIIFLILAFPIGVMCAFYLEEFAPKNRFTDLIEISINNLAAIPSIIYGLLGLTIYLQFMHLPRSSSLVGGMTLFMLVLPVIIIATRNTIRFIPQSIRDGAIALGASKTQVILHHLLPLSIPGIMTGTILAISRALGETAPLLMIGMVAFIADVPRNFLEPTTVLPVQIYLWSDSPEIGFSEKTSAAILILLTFLIFFNLIAIILRKKFERKW